MNSRSIKVGVAVQARYNDTIKGVITAVINEAIVQVGWLDGTTTREQTKFLVKAK